MYVRKTRKKFYFTQSHKKSIKEYVIEGDEKQRTSLEEELKLLCQNKIIFILMISVILIKL